MPKPTDKMKVKIIFKRDEVGDGAGVLYGSNLDLGDREVEDVYPWFNLMERRTVLQQCEATVDCEIQHQHVYETVRMIYARAHVAGWDLWRVYVDIAQPF